MAKNFLSIFILLFSFMAKGQTIVPDRQLVVRNLKVVEDPVRTIKCGAWTFCRMMTQLAGTQNPSDFTLAWLQTWLKDIPVGDEFVPKRTRMQGIIDSWPKVNGKLDLQNAPFRLLAIVSRTDLRAANGSNSGEGRFIYGLTSPTGSALSMTVIFEFKLRNEVQPLEGWVKDIHNLGDPALAFGSTYNSALQKFTDKFVRTKVAGQVNLSSIGQVRTNEIAIGSPWELREFKLNANNGKLVNVTTKRTPLASDNNSVELANFINSNEKAILNETHNLNGLQTAKNALADFRVWDAPGINNPEARFKFALNTCNGCHTSETSTPFVHLSLRQKGQVSQLSSFFQNVAVRDGKGVFRTFAEMKRRRLNLQSLIVLTQPGFSPQATLAETGLNAEQQLLSTDLPVGVEH